MTRMETARPESRAAAKTSIRRLWSMVLLRDSKVGKGPTVVFGPPGEVATADDILENKADDTKNDGLEFSSAC